MEFCAFFRRPVWCFWLIVVFLGLFVTQGSFASETLNLTILHMNDPHAHYVPKKEKESAMGGFGKALTVMNQVRAANAEQGKETLTFMAGDLLTGTPFSAVFKGSLGVELMNVMGFTAMAVGNHEFDYGQENLMKNLLPKMGFPLLSANIRTSKGDRVFEASITKKFPKSDTRVIIFGLTTKDTPVTTHPRNVEGLIFEDPIKAAKEIVKDTADSDLVIALTHIGVDQDVKLAEAVPEIDVIVGGHTHTNLPQPLKVGNTLIVQADAYSEYVGKLDLEVSGGNVVKYHGELMALGPDIKEDPQITAIIEEHQKVFGPEMRRPIGKAEIFLDGSKRSVRSDRTTNLGSILSYLMAEYAKTDVALINGGSIRESINEGPITLMDIYTVLPFSNIVVKMTLSGEELRSVLQRSVELEPGSGGKLQIHGIDYSVGNGAVKIASVGGKPFKPSSEYSVAISDFLAAGGDGYAVFKENGRNRFNYEKQVSELFIDFVQTGQPITAAGIEKLK
ncbi:bifunctional metallophosphatase/5'-nucleotidase [Desulfomonile tiedjei]|uniref:5'-nucleotidase/2',3'-cyclic phosphodiesterase-like hydrolase n=1 Tax=Desulfomonile tiedjei (strain ATCC 49306 / DSM 6799 / DCB-1) TaxID=706587 RepID=I4CA23_DESTA|nr:5'-nucleotidase C-terminal domain-containing protein [Desulfomonile tiedjei]AFM26414.1 5'-nucleotidase/2',3'-cyclic phosphodiesterase-like hydrolase [Desulfomonile tiedjei DSM 6799]